MPELAKEHAEQRPLALIVEDDATFRRLLAHSLEIQGFQTREAQNGLVAKTIFDLNQKELKLIISDIKMAELDGIGFLAYVRSKAQTPFILMTGFSELLETQSAFDLGASDFIAKPFSSQAMTEVIGRCLNPAPDSPRIPVTKNEDPPEEDRLKYCPVHIDEFMSTTKLRSDIYIRLSDKKYLKVAHAGDSVSLERLKTYKEKRVDYLYVTVEDFIGYVDFSVQVTSVIAGKAGVPKEKKLRLLKHTTEIIVERCFLSEVDQEIVGPATRMVEDTLAMVANDPDTFSIFSNLKNYSDRIYAHSVAVSIYSCMVAQQHGWTSASTQFRISIAGLLHDIGKKEIPKQIINKPRVERMAEDTALLQTHPVRGRDIVMQLRSLPEDIAQIVYQHHETSTGTGYPLGPTVDAIHPLAKLIGTVDRFADFVLPVSDAVVPLTPQAAFDKILNLNMTDFDATFLRRLMAVFKYKEKSSAGRVA